MIKWHRLHAKDGWELWTTQKTRSFPAATVYKNPDDSQWSVYGRNGNDCVAEGKHRDLTQAQMQAEKALKKWMKENE